MTYLERDRTFIEKHNQPINLVSRTMLGWYSGSCHPNLIDFEIEERKMNEQIIKQFNSDREKYLEVIQEHIQDWDPDRFFPKLYLGIVKPKWSHTKNKNLLTRATGVYAPTTFVNLLKNLLIDVEIQQTEIHFVDNSLQRSTAEDREQYGIAVCKQQTYLREHEYHLIMYLPTLDMLKIQKDPLAVPGVMTTYETISSQDGKWKLLTRKNLCYDSIKKIDDILNNVQPTVNLGYRPKRWKLDREKVSQTIRIAWQKQNNNYIAPVRNQSHNQWSKPLFAKKQSDDKSVSTSITASSRDDEIEDLKQQIKNMHAKL